MNTSKYPPAEELADLLQREKSEGPTEDAADEALPTRPAELDNETCAWLGRRGIDARSIAHLSLHCLRKAGPPWASRWLETGHRLLLELYDEHGIVRSVKALRVDDDWPLSLSPEGYTIDGLCLADHAGRRLLMGYPGTWGLVIVDEADFLATCQAMQLVRDITPGAVDAVPAVIGVAGPGSWSLELGLAIPFTSVIACFAKDQDVINRSTRHCGSANIDMMVDLHDLIFKT